MRFEKAFVPYGGYWSTPFVRWQGSLAQSHPVRLSAEVARRALDERGIEPTAFDSLFYGLTVPSPHSAPVVLARACDVPFAPPVFEEL